jgi:hypothetical protein
MAFTR